MLWSVHPPWPLLLLPPQGEDSALFTCPSMGSLPQDTVLHKLLQCESFPWIAFLHKLLQCGSPPQSSVLQEQTVLVWTPFPYIGTSETLLVKAEVQKRLTASALPLFTVSMITTRISESVEQEVSLHQSLGLATKGASEYGWMSGMNFLLSDNCSC